jgi:predicted dehydrogenase
MAEQVQYAVIGCGDHALRGHIIPGDDVPELKLLGVYDPDAARMRAASDAKPIYAGFTRYESEESLMADDRIDAVVICSPDRFHVPSLASAIEHGKHVLCDKPLASTLEDLRPLRRTLELAHARKLVVSSCHPRRFDPPYQWLKREVLTDQWVFGDVQDLHLDFSYHKPTKQGLHAGLLSDHFNHEFDLLHFLFGHAPAELHRLHDGQDRYLVNGMRDDGISFTFHGTRKLEQQHYREFVRLRFARGEVTLDCSTGQAVLHDHETGQRMLRHPGKTDYALRFRAVMANFAGAILGLTANYLTTKDLLANAESCVHLTRTKLYTYRPL